MGQKLGKSSTCEQRSKLMDERWRVLRQSVEVLTRADERVNAEESFLVNYAEPRIVAKIDKWLSPERSRIVSAAGDRAITELRNEMHCKMQKDYERAYEDLSRFANSVDELAEKQRKIHKKILDLEELGPNEAKKFRKKLARLRTKVFENLRASEKLSCHDKRLRKQFVKEVYDIDQENMKLCKKKVEQIIARSQKNSKK